MKRYAWLLATGLCACFVGSILLAQDNPTPKGEGAAVKEGDKPKGDAKKEGDGKKRLPGIAAKMDTIVTFTDDQKDRIAALNKTREAAVKAANEAFQKGVVDLLTPEQKTKWEQAAKEGGKKGEGKGDAPKKGGGDAGKVAE